MIKLEAPSIGLGARTYVVAWSLETENWSRMDGALRRVGFAELNGPEVRFIG